MIETVVTALLFIAVVIVWRIIKAGSRAAYRKMTEPADSLRKAERDSHYVAKDYGLSREQETEYRDVQTLGICFARLAISVSFADGTFDRSEYLSILSFFQGADQSFLSNISKMIERDLRNPAAIDWVHNKSVLLNLLSKPRYSGFDAIIFDGLLAVSSADNDISERELATIFKIMSDIGWSSSKTQAYFQSRFGGFGEQKDDNEQAIRNAYQILDLDYGAANDVIRKRYHALAKEFHPDMYATIGAKAQEVATSRFQTIKAAYELLIASRTA